MCSWGQRRSLGWESANSSPTCTRFPARVEWAGYYAGFCLGLRPGRPSISGLRCRSPLAVYPETRRAALTFPVRPCSGRGLPSQPGHPGRWWSLTPPFHPYRRPGPAAVYFLWHCLAGCPGWVLPTALLCGARTFLGIPGSEEPGMTRPSCRPIPLTEPTGPRRRCVNRGPALRCRILRCAPGSRRSPGRRRSRRRGRP
jgi:hypothetical protein